MIEAILAIAAGAIIGGLWRRWHGMGQGPRSLRLVVAFALCAPLLLAFDWITAGAAALIVTFYWVPGHELQNPRKMLLRYIAFPPAALAWWWASRHYGRCPTSFRINWFIDGPFAVAEVAAGALVYGAVTAVGVLI